MPRHTEDDTFRALKQTPFEDMLGVVKWYFHGKKRIINKEYWTLLKRHGWDPDTFQQLSNQHYNR